MLTLKSDDVYGRSKAYESIIKKTEIVGPTVPESFNVLVKELQGLGLKVDLMHSDSLVDAENILAQNIKEEGSSQSDIVVPQPINAAIDLTEDPTADEFVIMDDISDEINETTLENVSDEEKLTVVEADNEEAIL